jgi:tetratricopeptide (TPR) repeat protein
MSKARKYILWFFPVLFILIALAFIYNYLNSTGKKSKHKELLDQAFAAEDRHDYESAINLYLEILDISPRDYAATNSIAGLYGKEEQFADEIMWAQKTLDINPWFAQAYINMGNGYLGQDSLDMATACYRKAEKIAPNAPVVAYSLGVVEENKRDFEKAVFYYNRSVTLDSSFKNGYYNLAAAYADLKEFDKADKAILKLLALDPGDEEAKEMHRHIAEELHQQQAF